MAKKCQFELDLDQEKKRLNPALYIKIDIRDNPPNHLLVEPGYYHGDVSKITLLPWLW